MIERGDWPEVALHGVTELRVHGVGGASASDMLNSAAVQQVSGDRVAGVFRGPDAHVHGYDVHVEAYSWGGLTGRSGSNVLWLIFLPLSLVNMAGWMTPARNGDRRHLCGLRRGIIRVIGLLLTGVYVLFAAQVSMDLVAYQCGGSPRCAVTGWPGVGHLSGSAQRVAIGSLLPIGLLVVLWWLMQRSRGRYELFRGGTSQPSPERGRGAAHGDDDWDNPASCGLSEEGFWSGRAFALRLAGVHRAAGLLLVALLLAATSDRTTTSAVSHPLVIAAAGLLAATVVLAANSRLRNRVPVAVPRVAGRLTLSVALLDAVRAHPALQQPAGPSQLPGIRWSFNVTLGLLVATITALLLVDLALALPPRPWRAAGGPAWRTTLRQAYTPHSVVVLGALLATAPLSGTALLVARRLGTARSVATSDGAQLVYPHPFEALARGLLAGPLIAVGVGTVVALLTWFRRRTAVEQDTAHLRASWQRGTDGELDAATDPGWMGSIRAHLHYPAVSLCAAQCFLWTFAALSGVLALGYIGYWSFYRLTTGATDRYPDVRVHLISTALPLSAGLWLLTLLPVLALYLLRRGLQDAGARRLLGIVWDVGTFWPRSFHPLAPPSYAERAVPEICARLTRTWRSGGSVVLCGHSQGSVLVAAAVAALPREVGFDRAELPDRLSLITYGCPLTRLYARFFPAYVDSGFLDRVRSAAGPPDEPSAPLAWRNYYRDTDLVGHRVADPAVLRDTGRFGDIDDYLPDPVSAAYHLGDGLPRIRGHGQRGYREQAPFADYVAKEALRLRPACERPARR